jgi:hypothetical protein
VDNEGLFPACNLSSAQEQEKKEKVRPRLRKVDRRQMILHPWELRGTGSLDLSRYYDRVDAREGGGRSRRTCF